MATSGVTVQGYGLVRRLMGVDITLINTPDERSQDLVGEHARHTLGNYNPIDEVQVGAKPPHNKPVWKK